MQNIIKTTPRRLLVALILATLNINSSQASAAPYSPHVGSEKTDVHVLVAPYGWASSLSGDVTVLNRSRDFDIPFTEMLKHLDGAAEAHIEAGYGPFTLMLDPTYMAVSDRRSKGFIKPDLVSQTALIDAGLFYELNTQALSQTRDISVEALGGARYFAAKNSLQFRNNLNFSKKTEMAAPIVGGRVKTMLTPKTQLWLRGDYGGFHVDEFKQTWSATLGLSYSVNNSVELGLAYRVLKMEFVKPLSSMNTLMYGPMLGIGFHN